MRIHVKDSRELWAGALIIAIGCIPLFIGPQYPLGTAARMGPGYFPMLIGGLLVGIGSLIALRALAFAAPRGTPIHWRGLLIVSGSVAAFASAVDGIGFVVTSFVVVVAAALAGPGFRLNEVLLLATALTAGSVVVFVYFLGMPFSLFPF